MNGEPIVWAQQAIRRRMSAALERPVIAAIDLGNTDFTCLIARSNISALRRSIADETVDPFSTLPIIGSARCASRGVRDGVINDPASAATALSELIGAASTQAGHRPEHAIFSISGGSPRTMLAEGRTEITMPMVDDATVARVLASCCPEISARVRRPLHVEILDFERDSAKGLRDPRGASATRLSVNYIVTTVERPALEALAQTARQARIGIGGVACASAVSGMAALTDDEIQLGATCVDIGGETIGIAQFQRGCVTSVEVLPLGGAALTHDLATALEVPFAEAERQKTAQGGGLVAAAPSILGGAGPGEATAIHVGVIRPRVEEMLEMIGRVLPADRARPVVLTGGGSRLPGLVDLAQTVLNRRVRLGAPIRTRGAQGPARGAGFSAVHGLLIYAARLEIDPWKDALAVATAPERRFGGIVDWLRRNWQASPSIRGQPDKPLKCLALANESQGS